MRGSSANFCGLMRRLLNLCTSEWQLRRARRVARLV